MPRSAGNRTARRPPDHRKETQAEVVWSCLTLIRSGQYHLARRSEREKKTRQAEEEVGRQHRGKDGPGVRRLPRGSGEQRNMQDTGCEVICGAPTTSRGQGLGEDEETGDSLASPVSNVEMNHKLQKVSRGR